MQKLLRQRYRLKAYGSMLILHRLFLGASSGSDASQELLNMPCKFWLVVNDIPSKDIHAFCWLNSSFKRRAERIIFRRRCRPWSRNVQRTGQGVVQARTLTAAMPRIHARRRPPALPQDAPAPDSAPLEAIRRFLPYLWPKDDADLRRRAVISLAFLVSQKGVAVVIPLLFGAAVDLVSGGKFTILALFAVLGWYALARLLQQVFDELKHFVFARVAQRAIRNLALRTFRHMHALPLAFHLDRQTGGLSRVIERGAKSVGNAADHGGFSHSAHPAGNGFGLRNPVGFV